MSLKTTIRSRVGWLSFLFAVFLASTISADAQKRLLRKKLLENKARTIRLVGKGVNCTGFIVETNLVITSNHCLVAPLKYKGVPADVVAKDVVSDLALLATRTKRFEPTVLAEPRTIQGAYTFGHRHRRWKSFSSGYVFALTDRSLHSSVRVQRGDSGSGLFNDNDELIGIVSQHYLFDRQAVAISARHVECLWRPTVSCELARAVAK